MYGIIGLSAAVVALGGALVVLTLTSPKDGSNTSSSSTEATTEYGEGYVLIQDGAAEPQTTEVSSQSDTGSESSVVKSVYVKNDKSEFHLELNDSDDTSSARYKLIGYEDVPVDKSMLSTLAYNADELVSSSIIEENCTDPDKFGLGADAIKVELTYESGNVRTLYIGDIAPVSNRSYVMTDGSNTVYTVESSSTANYRKELKDFISKTIVEKPSDDDNVIVESLSIDRKDIDYDLLIEYDGSLKDKSGGTSSAHVLVKPTNANLTAERADPVINGMLGLIAEDIYSIHCQKADIKNAGLDDPFCTTVMKCSNGKTYTLLISEKFTDDDGKTGYYAMLDGGNIIYTISEENAVWTTTKPIDIVSRIMISGFVWSISDMEIKCGDTTEHFEASPKDSSKNRSECKTEDMSVKRNGSDFDAERYRQLYSFIIDANGEELALGEPVPSGEPMISVKIKDADNNTENTYEFYDYSAMRTLVVINGESKFYSTKSFVQTFISNVNKLDTNEEFDKTWK